MPCAYCNSNKTSYRCGKCGYEFCDQHLISTETYTCRKHDKAIYSREKARVFGDRCSVLDKSRCPECKGDLRFNKRSDGHFYLDCIDCEWNSYSGEPRVHYANRELTLKEAKAQKLIRKPDMCDRKLRKNRGFNVCPNCLVQLLKNGRVTSFATIKNMFNLGEQTVRLLNTLKNEKRISGFIDIKNQVFVYIPMEVKDKIKDTIENEGTLSVEAVTNRYDLNSEQITIDLIYEMLREYEIHGTFDVEKDKYYTVSYLSQWIIDTVNQRGRVTNEELAGMLNVSADIVKYYAMELLKSQRLNAYFANAGKSIVTKEKLKNEVKAYTQQVGVFKISEAARKFEVALELVRRTLFKLIQEKDVRGIFTQKREFITEQQLSEKIKGIAKAYRTIKLRDLARKLGITEVKVVEVLEHLIAHGAIRGYIDMNKHEFVADVRQPTTMGTVSIAPDTPEDAGDVEVLREYDFVGGQLHFKVVVRNNTDMAIHDIKVILDVPSSYNRKSDIITVSVIDPHNSRGVDFYLEPEECGISTIGGTVIYKDARGKPQTKYVRPKEVQIKCPLVVKTLDRIEDCQIAIQNMPSDARAFLIADLDPKLAYRAAFRAITNFDTRNVTSLEIPDTSGYKAEAWFSSEAKVTGGRIITRIAVDGPNQSLEIRVWCNEPGQLTGFLAKVVEVLFLEINMVRKVKAEARQKTLDVMSITQNLITASDYCAVRYDAKEILLKLEDTHARMVRIVGNNNPALARIDYWIEQLGQYADGDKISEADADSLMSDIEGFQNLLARNLAPD